MVEFNDRRSGKHQIYGIHGDPHMNQIDGIREAIDGGRRVLVAHAGASTSSPLGVVQGYLRQGDDGAVRAYHNSRSTQGVEIHPEDVSIIEDARKTRAGRKTYLEHDFEESHGRAWG